MYIVVISCIMVFNEQNLYKTIYLQLGAILIFQPLEENIDSYVNN